MSVRTGSVNPTEIPYINRGLAGRLFGGGRSPRRRKRLSFRAYWKQFKKEDVIMGYLFLLIPMAIFFTFFFIAMGFDFWMSFNTWDLLSPPHFVGSANYNYIFH